MRWALPVHHLIKVVTACGRWSQVKFPISLTTASDTTAKQHNTIYEYTRCLRVLDIHIRIGRTRSPQLRLLNMPYLIYLLYVIIPGTTSHI